VAAGITLLSAWATAALADDENPNINKRGDDEKKFMLSLAKAIVKAAHTTAKDTALEKSDIKKGTEGNRETIVMQIVYYGAITKKKYTADVEVKVDTSKKDEWKVLEIDYKDDNTKVKHNKTNLEKLVHKLNGQS